MRKKDVEKVGENTEGRSVVAPIGRDSAAASMRPPASPSCRLALRAGSHSGLGLRPGGKGECIDCGSRMVDCGMKGRELGAKVKG